MITSSKLYGVLGLVLAGILFLGVNLFSHEALRGARVDVTDNDLYTLSAGSKRIAAGIQEPVTLRLYFSESLSEETSGLRDYAQRVRELLAEYVRAGAGGIVLQVVDPEPFSDDEEKAVAYGLESAPVPGSPDRIFFGLVGTNTTDGQEIIPFFDPRRETSLEYDVTKLVYKLAHPDKRVVGLMSSLPLDGAPQMPFGAAPQQEPWYITRHLREFFDVRSVEPTAQEIPADVKVLVLVHPKNLPDPTLYALDQFVLRGGNLIVFVDPLCEADQPMQDPSNPFAGMQEPKGSNLGRLFDAWGIELVADSVVADRKAAIMVNVRGARGQEVVPFVTYLQIGPDHLDRQDVVTADLGDLKLGMAGALQKKEGAGVEFTPLIETSDEARLEEESRLRFFPQPQDLLKDYAPQGRFTLAARLRGRFATAFPEGKPAAPPEPEGEPSPPEEEAEPEADAEAEVEPLQEAADQCNVIVVADADMLSDRFWVSVQDFLGTQVAYVSSQNADFLVYAIENLSGSNDLLGIPSRKEFSRPFQRVQELQQAAQERFQASAAQFQEQLRETQNKLRNLRFEEQGSGELVLSPEQRAEIRKLQEDEVRLQRELRNVQLELNKDIDRLGRTMKVINIALIPALVCLAAVGLGLGRGRRRKPR
ncbi:MAG: hypothetical protein EYC70_00040 [Planctomycetota bacterium]|nr:MAG: hypothetical protein EYC70_00040 [Planctomycetota bacterium]